jgi:small subunit ribosomal protein S3e
LGKALLEAGYAGIEVRVTPVKTEIRIKATKAKEVMGV